MSAIHDRFFFHLSSCERHDFNGKDMQSAPTIPMILFLTSKSHLIWQASISTWGIYYKLIWLQSTFPHHMFKQIFYRNGKMLYETLHCCNGVIATKQTNEYWEDLFNLYFFKGLEKTISYFHVDRYTICN